MNVVPADSVDRNYDIVVIGAGFYGCVLAAHLCDLGYKVLLCEQSGEAMSRASAVNQARVHTGFHYPRSFVTSLRSLHNRPRFVSEYRDAVVSDFQMLYAVARRGTKVNAQRFYGMYKAMRAPIREATATERSLFDSDYIEDAFLCDESSFNYKELRNLVFRRLDRTNVTVAFNCYVERVSLRNGELLVTSANGTELATARVYNVGYAQLNAVLKQSGLTPLPLKHELVEIALVRPPETLRRYGVTVMDGAYFSTMPYPARQCYSLTHVRYTPHYSWTDQNVGYSAYEISKRLKVQTRWKHMVNDSKRYMPLLGNVEWAESIYDIKTVPIKNEIDDGRPILLHQHAELPGLWSVLGSKIDNIYDLLELVN